MPGVKTKGLRRIYIRARRVPEGSRYRDWEDLALSAALTRQTFPPRSSVTSNEPSGSTATSTGLPYTSEAPSSAHSAAHLQKLFLDNNSGPSLEKSFLQGRTRIVIKEQFL